MEPLKATLISTAMIHILLALIVRIHTPGLQETFHLPSMPPTRNKVPRRFTHWMNSKAAPSIHGEVWLVTDDFKLNNIDNL